MSLQKEFYELQKTLLKHKFLYYIKCEPEITDHDYDMLEEKSLKLARALGFRGDKNEGPEKDEEEHVHWMVDFRTDHPLWEDLKKELNE